MNELTNYLIEQRQALILAGVGLFVMAIATIVAIITYLDGHAPPSRFIHLDIYSKEQRIEMNKQKEEKRNGTYAVIILALLIGLGITGAGANQYVKATTYIEQTKGDEPVKPLVKGNIGG